MIELHTKGNSSCSSFEMPLYYQAEETFSDTINSPHRYKIVIIQSGSGILMLNKQPYAFIAPTLGCFSETTHVAIEKASYVKAEAIYFHPSVINSRFTFTSIQHGSPDFLSTDEIDVNSLAPFRHAHQRGWLYNVSPVMKQRVQELMKRLSEQLNAQKTFWPCRARSFLIECIFLIHEVYIAEHGLAETEHAISDVKEGLPNEPPLPLSQQSEEIYAILVYLLNNYHQKITLTDLTRLFKTNRSTLNKKFKHATGFSVIDYLIQLRVRMACQLLKDTGLSVSEISDRIGYIDLTHFGRIFRKYMHVTPRAYREQYQGDNYIN